MRIFFGGDFEKDDLPGGVDFAWLSAIIHMLSPDQNRGLFRKIEKALLPGGRLVIRDHIMESNRISPEEGAIFAVNMLVGTKEGGTYTFEEVSAWLKEARFTGIKLYRGEDKMDDLVECTKKDESS